MHVAADLGHVALSGDGVGLEQRLGELNAHGEGDQVLLHALVEVAFEPLAIGIGSENEPFPRRAQLRDVGA